MIASVHLADVGAGAALKVLRRAPDPARVPGLRSARVATAAPLGGSVLPAVQPGRVGLVAFWDGDDALDRFLAEHPLAATLAAGWRLRLAPLRAFGTWPGLPAEVTRSRAVTGEGPAAVLTLGRLRLSQAVRFFRASSRAENDVVGASGLTWATGLARPPFVATCSLWESGHAASTYAYRSGGAPHPTAIEADRTRPFHHQSAFIRFRPYASEGRLDGRNPLPEHWPATA